MNSKMNNIYQLKITLKYSRPPIWRRVLVNKDLLLSSLHRIIQTVMGWSNSHLHQFIYNGQFYSLPSEDDGDDMEIIDYSKIKLSDLLENEKNKMIYEYDFGDGWEHEILLEKILPFEKDKRYPICLDGKRNCPPEDCGGIGGYENLLEIIKDPKNNEYNKMVEWLGEYNPEYFDVKDTNMNRPY
ncbi:MAG: plasmid pRiA4b ORF-3 family protein [Candidatus Firestonebacteria bacterium]